MTKCGCPKCGGQDCEVVQDEIDIGVGVPICIRGFECTNCGPISLCMECGQPDFKDHAKWCSQKSS